MPTQVVDFDETAEVLDEYVTHPAGYEGVFRATESKKIERDGAIKGVEISGTVDGANVREYLARYQDRDTGKMGFAAFRVADVLTAFGLRKHGDAVNPTTLLKVTEGKSAKVRLKIHAYGKCKSCGRAGTDIADDETCRCGGLIERRERNEVDKWLEPGAQVRNIVDEFREEAAIGRSCDNDSATQKARKQAGRQANPQTPAQKGASNDAWG